MLRFLQVHLRLLRVVRQLPRLRHRLPAQAQVSVVHLVQVPLHLVLLVPAFLLLHQQVLRGRHQQVFRAVLVRHLQLR